MPDEGRADTEGMGMYVPGRVLVITSVSTVLFKSTTPSRLGASFAPSIVYDRLAAVDIGRE